MRVSRRALMSAAAGLAVATRSLPARLLVPAATPAPWCPLPRGAAGTSPDLLPPPFTVALPRPAVLEPESTTGEADRYVLVAQEADVELLPGVLTPMLTLGGTFPAPTIVARPGRPVELLVHNLLPVPVSLHLHGAITPAASDGHPDALIQPGDERTYSYPLQQGPATLWFHDHRAHHTGEQVYRGLAGAFLVVDKAEAQLGLPAGDASDVLVLLGDKQFAADGSLVYGTGSHGGFLGDVTLVNGAVAPIGAVPPGRVRLRLVNAANARRFDLARADGAPLRQVACDLGLLDAPTERDVLTLWPAERAEVVVDLAPGQELDLIDRAASGRQRDVLRLAAAEVPVGDLAPLPERFRDPPQLPAPTFTHDVTLSLEDNARWLLNGAGFDDGGIDARPRLGGVTRWRFHNSTPMAHPMHLHLTPFRVRSRQQPGGAPVAAPAFERGWKDTLVVAAGEVAEVSAVLPGAPPLRGPAGEDYTGNFTYHCHILEHEDHDMMREVRVIDLLRLAGSSRAATAAAASAAAFPDGAAVAVVAAGARFADALAGGPAAVALGGPLLLVDAEGVPEATAAELDRLGVTHVLVLGGEAAVSQAVVAQLSTATRVVERVAGEDRYATAAAVAARTHPVNAPVVHVACGTAFPDALSGGVAAALAGGPLLLTAHDRLPTATAEALDRLEPGRIVVLGGAAAVADPVVAALRSYAGEVVRIAGSDRYATAASVARSTFPSGARSVVIATGEDFPDALAAVPVAAAAGGPLLLTSPTTLPEATRTAIATLAPKRIRIIGGTAAVPVTIEDALAELL